MEKSEKTGRLIGLINQAVKEKKGDRIRHLTRIIANAYSGKPQELVPFFKDENEYLAGIATSAYNLITNDIAPIQSIEFGGLGAILTNTEEGLTFNQCQLWYSKNSGYALRSSKNSEYTLWYSKNNGNALGYSENSGDALRGSKRSFFNRLLVKL